MNLARVLGGRLQRAAFRSIGRTGVDVRLRRNSQYTVSGLHIAWAPDESNITRGLVVEHRIAGRDVRFFVSDENDLLQQHHLMGQFFENNELEVIAKHFEGGTFVDIGANVGNHTLYAALFLKAERVIAFEPNPTAFKILGYNILLNGIAEKCRLHNQGLYSKDANASVVRSPERNLGGTRLAVDQTGSLRLVRGDDALRGDRITFIKIDVEALEIAVLAGLRKTIHTHQPAMLVEVDDSNRRSFFDFLESVGYCISNELASIGNSNFLIRPGERAV
ncbi:MAG TPA: FkbM family methyltransferase [Sphingomicrobium sp.]|jgi:FkbM family methyltransferase|nr:FkbM family methyltransferase [Sphingomicrobium sp.]